MLLLTDTQEVDAAIKPLDKKGQPAQVDGVPVWTSSNPAAAVVVPASDGLSAVIRAATELGSAQVSVSADADLGDGVNLLTGVIDVEVVGGAAVTLGIVVGTPREQAV